MTDANHLKVVDNPTASRFEVATEDGVAELIYHKNGNRLVLIHTEVPDALSGRGIGGHLVQAAVDQAVERGETLVPLCPYARSWLERHPDQAARVTIEWAKPGR